MGAADDAIKSRGGQMPPARTAAGLNLGRVILQTILN